MLQYDKAQISVALGTLMLQYDKAQTSTSEANMKEEARLQYLTLLSLHTIPNVH